MSEIKKLTKKVKKMDLGNPVITALVGLVVSYIGLKMFSGGMKSMGNLDHLGYFIHNPYWMFLGGIIMTLLWQSSSLSTTAIIALVASGAVPLPAAVADADQLLQVLLNLIKNASEACKDSGKIKLKTSFDHSFRLRRSDGSGQALPLQIQIIDNGPGLPADISDQVFDPFVSGKENGTGLGLALASKIISDHDGWISVDSVPGNTVFTISLAAFNVKDNSFISEAS